MYGVLVARGAQLIADHSYITQNQAKQMKHQRAALLFWPFTIEWTISSSHNKWIQQQRNHIEWQKTLGRLGLA